MIIPTGVWRLDGRDRRVAERTAAEKVNNCSPLVCHLSALGILRSIKRQSFFVKGKFYKFSHQSTHDHGAKKRLSVGFSHCVIPQS